MRIIKRNQPPYVDANNYHSLIAVTRRKEGEYLQNLIDTSAKEEIIHAAQISLHAAGQRDAAAILKQVTTTTPKQTTRIKKVFHRNLAKNPQSVRKKHWRPF
ncbi:hypothetical protein KPH14_003660 [Odynerus spinipes]|uniref:Uncharacterized protein n=1 Tax=Odynerus spinipes TaxID=1348599 RepID=A0AAD9RET0_9HYME|nr:hypothetical protein KPH14_003660 [Odynerus spinipes]